jgi:uncharacterized membrane protein (UPF0182 family)
LSDRRVLIRERAGALRVGAFTALTLLVVWLLLRLRIEWAWFGQFQLQSVLALRWLLQTLAFAGAALIAAATLLWRRRWLRLAKPEPHPRQAIAQATTQELWALQGWRYGLALAACLLVAASSLAMALRLTWLALVDPFALSQWWSVPIHPGWPAGVTLVLLSVSLGLGLRPKGGLQLAHGLGSVCLCVTAGRAWGLWALALTIPSLGERDPLLGADVSFGLGRYSAIALGLELLLIQLLLTLSTCLWARLSRIPGLTDWAFPGLNRPERQRLRPLLALVCLLFAALLWLSRHQLLWSQDGVVAGAGWLDVHLVLPLRQLAAIAFALLAVLVVPIPGAIRRRRLRLIVAAVAAMALLAELLLVPPMQWLIVKPRELMLETPYLERAIAATRRAFQLDAISSREINPSSRLQPADLEKGASTLRNIRLWDSQPLLATNRQLQQLRVYYRFSNAAVDRYQLQNDTDSRQQVILAARELDQASLPDRSRTWLNRHFVFTHGFGFTMSPVNTRAADGLPEYFISDLGLSTRIEGNPALQISAADVKEHVPIGRAALYFGLLPSPYAVAPTTVEEFDFPEGDRNIYNHYSGAAGVPLRTGLDRVAAAVYLKEPRLLNTGALTSESRLLLRRDVKGRVKALAPFLQLWGEPYLVSVPIPPDTGEYDSEQHQYWIVDGFTTSNTYPYASNLPDGRPLRYARNAVKAVVDAYNGSVHLYVQEPNDPIVRGWQRLFPQLFEPISALPGTLRQHLMVPPSLFELQVQQLLRYHVTDPRIFYSGDDVWQVPLELYGTQQIPVAPYHITAQLRANEASEFLLLQPLTPLARPNLSAWLAARSDDEHYGELVLLRFPSDVPIFGPEQIQALINQNPAISQQFGLWDRAGSQVVQGNLLVVPLGNALLYVEPVYLRARRGGLPTLTRVVVSDGSRVAMAANLIEGLNALMTGRVEGALVQELSRS